MKILNSKKVFYLYLIALILLSILPINGANSSLNNNYVLSIRLDYLAHFIVLLPYFLLINKEVKTSQGVLLQILLALLFASFLETVQYILPYRTFNINDLIANWIGIALSITSFHLVLKAKKMFNFTHK